MVDSNISGAEDAGVRCKVIWLCVRLIVCHQYTLVYEAYYCCMKADYNLQIPTSTEKALETPTIPDLEQQLMQLSVTRLLMGT